MRIYSARVAISSPSTAALALSRTQPPTRPLRRPFGKRAIYDHFNLVATLPLPRAFSLDLNKLYEEKGAPTLNKFAEVSSANEQIQSARPFAQRTKYPSSSNAIQVFSFWILRRRITPGTGHRWLGSFGLHPSRGAASFIKVGTASHSRRPCNTESEANEARRDLIYGASFLAKL